MEVGDKNKVRKTKPTISITGGIGNQLFQWVAAHTLFGSRQFRIDLHHYQVNPDRKFELAPLVLQCPHCQYSKGDPAQFAIYKAFEWAAYHGMPTALLETLGYLQERNHPHDLPAQVFQRIRTGRPLLLEGLFQNSSLVEQGYPYVEAELTQVLDNAFSVVRSRIELPDRYAAVHVRRGDYPMSLTASGAIGQLADSFFLDLAIKTNLPILLLTENSQEVSELCDALKPAFVLSDRNADALQSLAIFANSDFLIGSNSSLSWWGAYLAGKHGKPSCLPKDWSQWGTHENPFLKFETIEFAPSAWKII